MSAPERPTGELAHWGPAGRVVRGGSWDQQAEPTLDRIAAAFANNRDADAAALIRHLPREATETHDLFIAWSAQLRDVLRARGIEDIPGEADDAGRFESAWTEFRETIEFAAVDAEAGTGRMETVERAVGIWIDAHDAQLRSLAVLLAKAVDHFGEAQLGDLWADLQSRGIDEYRRYGLDRQPWTLSFAQLTQIALEGMHAHYGGPRRRGEIDFAEYNDRVELTFAPCGSGGQLVDGELFGRTSEPYPFAWNEIGVCHYCVHCCVLQQLEPIKRLGYPGRVINPPLARGDTCRWTIYRDPAAVPDDAYVRVGEEPPSRKGRE